MVPLQTIEPLILCTMYGVCNPFTGDSGQLYDVLRNEITSAIP